MTGIFDLIYRPVERKIYTKVGFLRPKTMAKELLDNSLTTLITPENGCFDPENGQNIHLRGPTFDQIFIFWTLFIKGRDVYAAF